MNTFQISVTKDIYEKAKYCGTGGLNLSKEGGVGSNCAIALAIRDLFPDVWVNGKELIFVEDWSKFSSLNSLNETEGEYGRVRLPMPAQYIIYKFDDTKVEDRENLPELRFKIKIPDDLLEKIVDISAIQEILKESKTLQLV